METESSLPYSQWPTTELYPEQKRKEDNEEIRKVKEWKNTQRMEQSMKQKNTAVKCKFVSVFNQVPRYETLFFV